MNKAVISLSADVGILTIGRFRPGHPLKLKNPCHRAGVFAKLQKVLDGMNSTVVTEMSEKKQPAFRQWPQTFEYLSGGHSDHATAAQDIGQSHASRTDQLQLQRRCCSWY